MIVSRIVSQQGGCDGFEYRQVVTNRPIMPWETLLRDLRDESNVPLERLALKLARISLVVRASPETIAWIIPMLREFARTAACRGDDHRAGGFDTAADALCKHFTAE